MTLRTRKPPTPAAATKNLTRKQAAKLIERFRIILAVAAEQGGPIAPKLLDDVLRTQGVAPLERCTGEAHSNPHIDHCSQCAPRWGWTGEAIEIR